MGNKPAKRFLIIEDLSHSDLNILKDLEADWNGPKVLVAGVFQTSSAGGQNILWQSFEPGMEEPAPSISTEALDYQRINDNVSVPVYTHYVLSEEGLQWVKEIFVEAKI